MKGIGAFFAILLHAMTMQASPIGKKTSEGGNFEETYNNLRNPVNKVICNTRKIRQLFLKEKSIKGQFDVSSYDKSFKNECIKMFGAEASKSLGKEKRFIYAMKKFQQLVGLTQDMQLSESRINAGDETQFVRDFRGVEYEIRELVEDRMRAASVEIVRDAKSRKEIPAYSVGGLFDEKLVNPPKEATSTVNKKNYQKMHQIEECLNTFRVNVIFPEAGEDSSFEC